MSYLILIRHGQSTWNLERKFTGWVDVDLTEKGKLEARKAGDLIKDQNIKIKYYYSSLQLRAINTLKLVQQSLHNNQNFTRAWELNERHYGELTGLNKIEMSKKLGEEKVYQFRRSWDLKPGPLDKMSPFHPSNIDTYKDVPIENIPDTESLKDTFVRVTNYYELEISKKLNNGNILISAHGNSIRALCKYLFKLDKIQICNLEIPTGNPLLIKIDKNKNINSCKYLDQDRAKDLVIF
ncbi:2,3-diphosphoglycerate-dependent phosphoglycerate mutase [Candidatus Pelagibacter sp.]|nr:2,3-diphosphoglycerate-dependent phosphoglycerate mutase [Candidatus Pelagibacter sp.]